eukprot:12806584-Alexandrium_andersonii.AAC.1
MSASLVGSEMCIRDRMKGVALTCEGVAHGIPRPPGLWSVAVRIGGVGGCLLYTSDAADDM